MKHFISALVATVLLCSSACGFAFGVERYVEGVHYTRVADGAPAPGSVIEFFSFGCPHCAHFEPALEQWLQHKPAQANFSRVPATWNPRFEFLGRVYYTLVKLDMAETTSQAMFDHIHKDNKPLRDEKDVAAFLAERGVEKDRFEAAWNSAEVKANLQGAGQMLSRYKVGGVPAFLVAGQYMTSVSQAGSEAELFSVVEFLLTK